MPRSPSAVGMAQNKKRKRWVALALGVGLAIIVMLILASRGQDPVVSVVQITRQDLNAVVTSNGKVEPISPTIARAQYPAFVKQVLATEGQSVRRGEVILRLDSSDIQSQLAQA